MEVIKEGDYFIYDDGNKGHLMILKDGCFRVIRVAEESLSLILELDEYNRENH